MSTPMRAALRRVLSEFVPAAEVDTILQEALGLAQASEVPTEPAAVRAFVMGPVRRALIENRGVDRFALAAVRVAHEMADLAGSLPAGKPVLVVFTLDAAAYEKIRNKASERADVRHARRLLDLAPLSSLRRSAPSTLVVHVDRSPASLTALARVAGVLHPDCSVLLAGVSERALAQLAARFGGAASWKRVASMDEAAAGV